MKALITGSSSGIGKAIYEGLKEKGWECYGLSRRGPDYCIDLCEMYKENVLTLLPNKIDLLLNAAGIMPFVETRKIMDINFWGALNLMIWYKEASKFSKGACVINIASVSGVFPDPELPIYAASKAALISVTKSYAKLWAPDVRVNCISPGFYMTNLVPEEPIPPQHFINNIPMGYAEKPETLLDMVLTIYNTKYINGSNIIIDGGYSL